MFLPYEEISFRLSNLKTRGHVSLMDKYDEKALRRLQAFLTPQPNGCQNYIGTGSPTKRGYTFTVPSKRDYRKQLEVKPNISFSYRGESINPRKVAYVLSYNCDMDNLKKVYSTCNNYLCCNPDHLMGELWRNG
jgi:hypothetical protein